MRRGLRDEQSVKRRGGTGRDPVLECVLEIRAAALVGGDINLRNFGVERRIVCERRRIAGGGEM